MRKSMPGKTSARLAPVVVLALTLVVASCADAGDKSEELSSLPAGAMAAVNVQPQGIESIRPSDVSYTYVVNADGDLLGRIRGKTIHAAQVLSVGGGLVTALDDSVVTLAEGARRTDPVDTGGMARAAVSDPVSGQSMFWFDTGGRIENGYTNTYVAAGVGAAPDRVGTVDGWVQTTAYCGGRNLTISGERLFGSAAGPERSSLHELGPDGGLELRGQWEWPSGFRSITPAGACTPDGGELVALYFYDNDTVDRRTAGLTLVRIDVESGEQMETRLELPDGLTWSAPARTFSVVGDRVYWMTQEGHVVSVAIAGDPLVRIEWTLPEGRSEATVVVDGDTVIVVRHGTGPDYAEYGLVDGALRRGPIGLPWLADIVGGTTRSGSSVYTVSNVARLDGP